MAISIPTLNFFLEETKRRKFSGKILTLGRMNINFSYEFFQRQAKKKKIKLRKAKIILSHNKGLADKGYISDKTFFESLGFDEIKSLDIVAYENPDFTFDLNNPNIPKELINSFDVIFDGGTMEHIFNIPIVLNSIFQMLKIGGRIIHISLSL